MKYIILLTTLFMIGCATSDIVIDKDSAASVKSVAIVPFTSEINLKKEVLAKAGSDFRSAFVKLDYKIAGDEKTDLFSKENNFTLKGASTGDIKKIGGILGADAILFGEIVKNEEVVKEVPPTSANAFGTLLFNGGHDETVYKTTYKFQINIKLVKVSDGSVILTMKNRYAEAEKDEYMPGYMSLDAYREMVLKNISNELVESLSGKKL